MKRKRVSYAKYGYLFSLPFIVTFLVCTLYPIVYTGIIGFTNLKGSTMAFTDAKFLPSLGQGLWDNFVDTLNAPTFHTAVSNTVKMWIINFIPQITLALILAAWFTNNQKKIKAQGFFKVVFYLPNIITAATIGILFANLFAYPKGPINDILLQLGFIDNAYDFSRSATASQLNVSFMQFWTWYGNTMIVLIAGILGINPEMYEAAEIDGASGNQQFFYITIPNLKTMLLYTLVTSLIGGMQMFDIPRVFQNGLPQNATLTATLYIYTQAFSGTYQYNKAASASLIIFVIISILSAILFVVLKDKDEAKLHKIIKKQEKEYRKKVKLAKQQLLKEGR
ncbi:MAG: sugar ABC transporter permease [Lachnospiraceae bacterium]|nr:sugar ABC transporter permease [Lachnospiraceae bacterium]